MLMEKKSHSQAFGTAPPDLKLHLYQFSFVFQVIPVLLPWLLWMLTQGIELFLITMNICKHMVIKDISNYFGLHCVNLAVQRHPN